MDAGEQQRIKKLSCDASVNRALCYRQGNWQCRLWEQVLQRRRKRDHRWRPARNISTIGLDDEGPTAATTRAYSAAVTSVAVKPGAGVSVHGM